MYQSRPDNNQSQLIWLFFLVLSWFAITLLTPSINKLYDFHSINPWILAYIRMALMLAVSWIYIHIREKQSFFQGFNISFKNFSRNLFWAVVFFAAAYLVEKLYNLLIMKPLIPEMFTASSSGGKAVTHSLGERLFEYFYIVFEGVVEVFVFIGVLVDRLAKRWGWTMSIITGNIIFALWHYSYWRMGWLPGTVLIVLTFIMGFVISLNYMKTKNTLSSALCHIFVDSPSAIKILLGK
ncbi:MAG: CPBP family intramembrane metalloprotease [Candidatus Aminicenantes bacterium]|nr:CPBP family intramembrane metalloprotease [Candidatus Aminicenantes bacterium]